MHVMLVTLLLTPALLPSIRILAPRPSPAAGVRHPQPSAILWEELSTELDSSVPVYVVANQAGRPLEYEAKKEDGSSGRSLFLCYVDPAAAQAALEAALGLYPMLGLRLLPTGLGSAISKANEGGALLIPAAADLQAAREAYPDGEDWEGGQLLTPTLALALALALAPTLTLILALALTRCLAALRMPADAADARGRLARHAPLPQVRLPLPLPLTLTLTLTLTLALTLTLTLTMAPTLSLTQSLSLTLALTSSPSVKDAKA